MTFEVVRTDNRFGGFEVLRHKGQNARVSSHCFYLSLLIEGTYRTHASSANPLPQIAPLNLMTCTVFLIVSLALFFSFELYRIALQQLLMKEGCSGTIHPMYTQNDRKWVLISIPDEHSGAWPFNHR